MHSSSDLHHKFKMFCHTRRFWSRWWQHGRFSCSQCDSTFTEKTNVTRHIREKHQIEQGNKNFRRKLQLMSQKQLGNIVLKAINPQETLSAAEKSMLDKFVSWRACNNNVTFYWLNWQCVQFWCSSSYRHKEYAQCTFLIKTSNIFNVPIVIDLIAYWLGTPEAVGLGHARACQACRWGDSAILVTGHPDILTEDTLILQIQTAIWYISD